MQIKKIIDIYYKYINFISKINIFIKISFKDEFIMFDEE